jgi:hypothetical protein
MSPGELFSLGFGGILFFLAGLILFIIGLVNKKQKMFITGLSIFIVGLVALIVSLFIGALKLSEKIKKEANKNQSYFNSVMDPQPNPYAICGDSNRVEKNSAFGYITDENGNNVYVKVQPGAEFISKGIRIESIRKSSSTDKQKKHISLALSFESSFSGRVTLTAYSLKSKELGKSTSVIDSKAGSVMDVAFLLSKNILFSDISYCKIEVEK